MSDETAGDDGADQPPDEAVDQPSDEAATGDQAREEIDSEAVPDGATENHWKQLVVEMERSAEEHRHAGWGTTVLHPEASGAIDGDEPGIGVVVPREEFDGLDEVVSVREIDEYEVMRADLPGEIQLLTILYSADAEVAVFVPAAVDEDRLEGLGSTVEGTFYTHVTPPEDDATISFTHDDPSLFFPGTEMPRTARTRKGTSGGSDRSSVESDADSAREDGDHRNEDEDGDEES